MKKKITKLTALLLASMMLLTGCGGSEEPKENGETVPGESGSKKEESKEADSDEKITDIILPMSVSRELETFNILYAQRAEDSENLTNLVDGLLEVDTAGKLVPCIAEEWGTEDKGLTWTFKLRDVVK